MNRISIILAILAFGSLAGGAVLWMTASASGGAATPKGMPFVPPPQIREVRVLTIPARVIEGNSTDREVTIDGLGFYGTAFGPFVRFNGVDAVASLIESDEKIVAYAPAGMSGKIEVVVENPDHQAAKTTVEFK
ncbi:MAG: IPT/TIG domain-containing protein [Planctomycetota bacterium]